MFDIKNIFNKKNGGNVDENDFRSLLIKHRMEIVTRIVVIAVAIILALVAGYVIYDKKEYTGYEIMSEEERRDSEEASYIPYDGKVIKFSQDGAEAFDGYNNPVWNETYEMQNPKVETNADYVALGDFKGNSIFTVNSTGQQGRIDTKLPISAFCISTQGVVAAVLEDEDETKINLYSFEGELLASMKCTMTKSGYPVDLTLSPDGMKLGVSYVRIEGGSLKSSVAFYNFGEVGKNEIDNYVSGYDYVDTVVPKVKFINNDTAFAVGDNRLVIYKGNQKPTSFAEVFLNSEVQSVYHGTNTIGLVFREATGEGIYRLEVYDDTGRLKYSMPFDLEYTDIVLKDDYVVIYNDMDCLVYKLNGKLKFSGSFEEPMLLLVPGDSLTRWTLVNRDCVQSVKLN